MSVAHVPEPQGTARLHTNQCRLECGLEQELPETGLGGTLRALQTLKCTGEEAGP